jgi:hypothetical protein
VSLGLAVLSSIVIVLTICLLKPQNALPPTRPVSTPIVIRGGSMTAFTEKADAPSGWMPKPSNYPPPYCVDVKPTGGVFYAALHDDADPNPSASKTWRDPTAVDIYGHDPNDSNHQNPSQNGFAFILQQTDCQGNNGDKGNKSVRINTYVGSFYHERLYGHGNHIDNLRFLDSSAGCVPDKDLCERMAKVVVTIGGVKIPHLCPDGDCTVTIGTQ